MTYRTEKLARFGTTFGPTSYATAIDRLSTLDGARSLDGPDTGRVSYVEIR